MSIQRLQKYVNLALNNSSEGEARNAASRFFKTLKSLDMRFNSRQFGLTKEQALKLADLGGVVLKGVAPTKSASAEPKAKAQTSGEHEGYKFGDLTFKSKRALCYHLFSLIDMDDRVDVRSTIDFIVKYYNLNKRSVQSYASNYREEQSRG